MTKINMKQQPAAKQNLKELDDEQLKALQDALLETQKSLEEKSQTQQYIVTDKIVELKQLVCRIKEIVLPQIEFDIRLVTDVVAFGSWCDAVINDGRITITSIEFKRIIRALSVAKFKGFDTAMVLDELSAAFNDCASEINKNDAAYQANAVTLTEIDNEYQRRGMQPAVDDVQAGE